MTAADGDNPQPQRQTKRSGAKAKGALERALIHTWRLELRGQGFTDQESAQLLVWKLLYLRRRLRG